MFLRPAVRKLHFPLFMTRAPGSAEMALVRVILLPLFCLLSLSSCQLEQPRQVHEFAGLTMGTTWSVMINAGTLPLPRQRIQAQFETILNRVNKEMSTYLPGSKLSRINATGSTGQLPVSAPLMHVLQAARELSLSTRGAFDVTAGPLVNLWGFGPEQEFTVPTQEQIESVLHLVGYEKLHLDPATSTLEKSAGGMFIDLSAIAKGFGVDEVAVYLDLLQLDNYLVEIGGEIRAKGVNHKNIPWQVGIEQPVAGTRGVRQIITLEDMAMATSGDYRNYFEHEGIRYSHTIDPRTGRPVSHGLASVTVLHPSTMLADAWATGLLVLGLEQGYAMALENELAAYFIVRTDTGFEELNSPAFQPHTVTSLPKD